MNFNDDGGVKGFVRYKYPTTLATACLKRIFSLAFHTTDDPVFKPSPLGFLSIGGGIGGIVDKNIKVGFGTGQVKAEPIPHAMMSADDKDFTYVGVFVRR